MGVCGVAFEHLLKALAGFLIASPPRLPPTHLNYAATNSGGRKNEDRIWKNKKNAERRFTRNMPNLLKISVQKSVGNLYTISYIITTKSKKRIIKYLKKQFPNL